MPIKMRVGSGTKNVWWKRGETEDWSQTRPSIELRNGKLNPYPVQRTMVLMFSSFSPLVRTMEPSSFSWSI